MKQETSTDFIKNIKTEIIKTEAKKMANNPDEWEDYLINLIILYIKDYNTFLKDNFEKIKKIIEEEKNNNKEEKKFLFKKLSFFQKGLNLLITDKKKNLIINEKELNSYKKNKERIKIDNNNNLISKMEKEFQLKNFQKIEDSLQLAISFYKNKKIRENIFNNIFKTEIQDDINEKENWLENSSIYKLSNIQLSNMYK